MLSVNFQRFLLQLSVVLCGRQWQAHEDLQGTCTLTVHVSSSSHQSYDFFSQLLQRELRPIQVLLLALRISRETWTFQDRIHFSVTLNIKMLIMTLNLIIYANEDNDKGDLEVVKPSMGNANVADVPSALCGWITCNRYKDVSFLRRSYVVRIFFFFSISIII